MPNALASIALAVLVASPVAAQVLAPLEFTVVEQQASIQDCGASGSASGTSELTFPFSASCTHVGSVIGTLTSSNVDGRLVITVSGVYTPGTEGGWSLPDLQLRGRLAFVVPSVGGSATMTDVFSIATTPPSTTPGLTGSTLGIRHELDGPVPATSALLGAGYKPFDFYAAGTAQGSDYTPRLRETAQMRLPAGDTVTLPFRAGLGINALSASPQSFSETLTYELKYLPEPSASLMLPSGAAALALLAHLRAR